MRVLQVTHAYPPTFGGVESHVWDVAHGLVARGHELLVLTGGEPSPGDADGPCRPPAPRDRRAAAARRPARRAPGRAAARAARPAGAIVDAPPRTSPRTCCTCTTPPLRPRAGPGLPGHRRRHEGQRSARPGRERLCPTCSTALGPGRCTQRLPVHGAAEQPAGRVRWLGIDTRSLPRTARSTPAGRAARRCVPPGPAAALKGVECGCGRSPGCRPARRHAGALRVRGHRRRPGRRGRAAGRAHRAGRPARRGRRDPFPSFDRGRIADAYRRPT